MNGEEETRAGQPGPASTTSGGPGQASGPSGGPGRASGPSGGPGRASGPSGGPGRASGPSGQGPWVGRATPPPPPADPYWPPVEGSPTYGGPGYDTSGYAIAGDTGYPPPVVPRRRSGRTVLLIIAGVVAACCAGGATMALVGSALVKDGLADAAGPSAGDDQGQDGQGGSGEDGSGPGLGTPVRDGKFEFVVTSVSCGHESVGASIIKAEATGQFCIVDLSIANIGDEAQTFTDVFQKAFGPDGASYGADPGAGLIANEGGGVFWKVINPGNTTTGKIVYDIPAGASIAALELHDSVLSNGVTVTLAS